MTRPAVGEDSREVWVCGYWVDVVDLVGEGVVAVHLGDGLATEVARPGEVGLAPGDDVYPGLA